MTKRILLTAACLVAMTFSGCATFGSKPDAESDGDPEWLQNLKALKGTGESAGVSPESREIEKSLRAR
jgi:hypothetical protein